MFVSTKHVVSLMLLLSALVLAGCGGGGGGNSTNTGDPDPGPASPASPQTGVFVDSPVAGISYATQTQSGITNALGEFVYLSGETVTFSIGDIMFPAATASASVTPLDLVGTTNTNNQSVVNILRLLQTLDTDGDLSVINIDPAAVTAASGIVLDFTLATADFETAAADFLTAAVGGPTLVAQVDAVAHFEGVLTAPLVGAWLLPEGSGYNVLILRDGGRYFIAHTNNAEFDSGIGTVVPASGEYGTYTWDPSTGAFNVTVTDQSDGQGGLSDSMGNLTLAVAGDTLTLTDSVEGTSTLTRIFSNDLIGAWELTTNAGVILVDPGVILVFVDETRYIIVHENNTEFDGGFGAILVTAEHGTYTLDASTGTFIPTVLAESDGTGGLSDSSPDDTMTVDGNTLSWSGTDFKDGFITITFTRIVP